MIVCSRDVGSVGGVAGGVKSFTAENTNIRDLTMMAKTATLVKSSVAVAARRGISSTLAAYPNQITKLTMSRAERWRLSPAVVFVVRV
jgi:hypothetical protein